MGNQTVVPTKNPDDDHRAIHELSGLAKFLVGFYGVLAAFTAFFPLSNEFINAVPLDEYPEGAFYHLPTKTVTTISTILTLFFVLLLFTRRDEFALVNRSERFRKRSVHLVAIGVVSLLMYLILTVMVDSEFYGWFLTTFLPGLEDRGVTEEDLAAGGDFLLLIFYTASFLLFTLSFLLLSMIEYYRPDKTDGS